MSKAYPLRRPDSLVKDAWLRLGDLDGTIIHNKLVDTSTDNLGLTSVFLMRQPEYLSFAAKVLCDIDTFPEQGALLGELWNRPFPMVIASRGFSKSFSLALYATLRCALIPGTKIVGVGAAFRQSKVIFEYMEKIWSAAPVLRSVCDNRSGPRSGVDRCTMTINDSTATFLPIGNGEKIRGQRATVVLADEYASISPEIFETVIKGFGAVAQSPVEKMRMEAVKAALIKQGRLKEAADYEKQLNVLGNQVVLTGTADYSFMHFAEAWKKYYVFIKSKNNPDKIVKLPSGEMKTLREYFPDGVPESFNSDDYSIVRIPYKLIPKGFMDDKIVASAKSNSNRGVYLREYGACSTSTTPIITDIGIKQIEDIKIGDMVLNTK